MSEDKQYYITDDLSDISTKELTDILPGYFNRSDDISKNAYLNWRFDFATDNETGMFNMADAYFQTALILIENCLQDNKDKKADIHIFPILFNIVHGLEVYFKGYISKFRLVKGLSTESKIEGGHNIKQLCETAIKLTRENNESETVTELLFLQKFIKTLYEETNDMSFARYAIDKNKENQFYADHPGNITIELNVLRQWCLRMYQIVDLSQNIFEVQR